MLIYKITNDINNKVYIGQTSKTLANRIMNHKSSMIAGQDTHLYRAMRKYGWEHFTFEIIHDNISSKSELNRLETYYIRKFDSVRCGYNMTDGGELNPMDSPIVQQHHQQSMRSAKVRNQIKETLLNYYANNEYSSAGKKKLSEYKKAQYASPEGDVIRAKFRNSFKLSKEHQAALINSHKKSLYCVDIDNNVVAEFEFVKDAAIWWQSNGLDRKFTHVSSICDKIKRSYDKGIYYNGIKWIYRV